MEDADRLYQVGNLYLLDVTSFKDLREICEREDMNEAKTQLCVLGFSVDEYFFWALSALSGSVHSSVAVKWHSVWLWEVRVKVSSSV